MGSVVSHQLTRKGKSMTILTVGIDLAKNVFAVHGVNEAGKAELVRPAVARDKLLALIAALRVPLGSGLPFTFLGSKRVNPWCQVLNLKS